LDWLLKNAGCNKMCHYFHSRLLEQRKELCIFHVVETNRITVDAWVCFRLAPTFVLFLFLFSIHYKIHFNIQQNPDFGGCFKSSPPVGGASGFEARNGFRVPQNITCSVRVNRKSVRLSADADWIKRKKTALRRSAYNFHTPMIFSFTPCI